MTNAHARLEVFGLARNSAQIWTGPSPGPAHLHLCIVTRGNLLGDGFCGFEMRQLDFQLLNLHARVLRKTWIIVSKICGHLL